MDTWCTSDLRINQFDIGETIAQRRRRVGVFNKNHSGPPERRSTISSMTSSYQVTRMRNLSGGSSGSTASGSSSGSSVQSDNQYSSSDNSNLYFNCYVSPFANTTVVPKHEDSHACTSHRKLDRSLSDNDSDRSGSRYKTELCRPFEESGSCKYGDKCQFAHGSHELRNLARHPKYKTELCRTFHTIGFCPYGPRCHFIHEDDKGEASPKSGNSGSSSPSLSPTLNNQDNFSYSSESSQINIENTQINNSLTVNINYGNVELQSLEHQFSSALNLNRNCNESSRHVYNNNTSDEYDIFSSISVFNADEVVDNAPPKPSNSYSSSSHFNHNQSLDNYSVYRNNSNNAQYEWPSTLSSHHQSIGPVDPFNYSPTGSTGSSSSSGSSDSGSGSDCGGSTESLVNSGYHMDWRRPTAMSFTNLVC